MRPPSVVLVLDRPLWLDSPAWHGDEARSWRAPLRITWGSGAAEWPRDASEVALTAGPVAPRAMLKALRGETLGLCGPTPVQLGLPGPAELDRLLGASGESQARIPLRAFWPDDTPMLDLWIDNTDGPRRELGLGAIRLDLAAGARAHAFLPAPSCAAPLSLAGTIVGRLSGELATRKRPFDYATGASVGEIDPAHSWVLLLDAQGDRCYESRELKYTIGGRPSPFAGPGRVARHRRAHLHQLPPSEVHYFLRPAPDAVSADPYGLGGVTTIVEVRQVPCLR